MIAPAATLPREQEDFAPGLLVIQESPMPPLARTVFYTVAALFAALLAWALLARLDIVASAEGKLVPANYTQIVQPAEGGVVADILVQEGQRVEAGQTLIRLDPTLNHADKTSLAGELALKRLVLRRADAELAGQPLGARPGDEPALLAQVQAQAAAQRLAHQDALAQETATLERARGELRAAAETLTKLEHTLPSYEHSARAHGQLVAQGFLSPIAGNDKAREALEKAQDLKSQRATVQALQATVAAQQKKIEALTSHYRSQLMAERTEALGQVARLTQETEKAGYKVGLLALKAPQAGVVKDIATTTRGAVVQPGMVLMTLVPQGEPLVAEVQVRNDDVGFVRPGQRVRVKVAAYPFQKYGLLEGRIRHLAPDAQTNPARPGPPLPEGYKALVQLDTPWLESTTGNPADRRTLEAGMQVTAEIHQGHRSVMEYLLSPVQKVAAEAGRER